MFDMLQTKYSYIKAQDTGFNEQLEQLFVGYKPNGYTLRLVFFGNPSSCGEYIANLDQIRNTVHRYFSSEPPVFSYIAQPPLGGGCLAMEAVEVLPDPGLQFVYGSFGGTPYITIVAGGVKYLFIGGLRAISPGLGVREQADEIFDRLDQILNIEGMPISSIVRQWNYIENILAIKNGRQHYQEFNDSRSQFYNKTTFVNGYPAATGVGASCAGVIVDLDALHPLRHDVRVVSLNNSMQVPAHGYSASVLPGENDWETGRKSTPKFERGKVIVDGNKGYIYISGTAAIRGEKSINGASLEEQTRTTLENIQYLISDENLAKAGIYDVESVRFCSLRIYLKENHFYDQVKKIVEELFCGLPAVYLKGDVCRHELLVEIEGFAFVDLYCSKTIVNDIIPKNIK